MLITKLKFLYIFFIIFSTYSYKISIVNKNKIFNLDKLKPINVIEPYYKKKDIYKNISCILFFSGGSSFITPQIYNNFFIKLVENNFSVYTPSFKYKNIDKLIDILDQNYKEVIIAGHSSGASVALNNCNNYKIRKLILLDPVNTRIFNVSSLFNITNINLLIYFNALKSYKITFNPFGLPFIPFLRIKNNNLNFKNLCNISYVNSIDFGHADILDKPYADFMHNTRIAVGNKNRSFDSINNYHKFISNNIKELLM